MSHVVTLIAATLHHHKTIVRIRRHTWLHQLWHLIDSVLYRLLVKHRRIWCTWMIVTIDRSTMTVAQYIWCRSCPTHRCVTYLTRVISCSSRAVTLQFGLELEKLVLNSYNETFDFVFDQSLGVMLLNCVHRGLKLLVEVLFQLDKYVSSQHCCHSM